MRRDGQSVLGPVGHRLADLFSDYCSNFNNWNNGSAWAVQSSDYFRGTIAAGQIREISRPEKQPELERICRRLGQSLLYQWVTPLGDIFYDSCNSFNNWNNGSAGVFTTMTISGPLQQRGQYHETTYPENSQDLSAYAGSTVRISWEQWVGGTPESADGLDFALSADGAPPGATT